MNIKNRLKKLEYEVIDDSPFCRCSGAEPKIEFRQMPVQYDCYEETGSYVPYQNSQKAIEVEKQQENEQPTVEHCERCGKQINKRLIILNSVGKKTGDE